MAAAAAATRVSWSPMSGLKGVQPPLPFANMLLEISGEITLEHEEAEPKQKQHAVVDVPGDRSKV